MCFALDDDLGEHAVRDVIARFGIEHLELDIFTRQLGQIIERDIFG